MSKKKNETGALPEFKGQILDANNRTILKDPLLCCQFLNGYVDIPAFKDIQPEDIQDETEKYQAYLGIQFESDTVKKVKVKGEKMPFYVISLVEHKGNVYYNVSMQLLKYLVCIWDEYGKEMKRKGVSIDGADFKYPPIIPIVYYEGMSNWTADMHFKDRVYMSELFEEYIPDFTYKLVDVHSFSNEELLGHNDEMSLLMFINKVQSAEDFDEFFHSERDKIDAIIKNAPERIIQIISSVMWNLCMKINIPTNEAEECVNMIRGRRMGQWFENMEVFDVQERLRNTEERERAVEEREHAVHERESAIGERESAIGERESAIDERESAVDERERRMEKQINYVKMESRIKAYFEMGLSAEDIAKRVDFSIAEVKNILGM